MHFLRSNMFGFLIFIINSICAYMGIRNYILTLDFLMLALGIINTIFAAQYLVYNLHY